MNTSPTTWLSAMPISTSPRLWPCAGRKTRPAQGHNLGEVEIGIADSHVVGEVFIAGRLHVRHHGVSGAVCNNSGDAAGIAIESEGCGDAGAAGEPGGVDAVFVDGQAAMRIGPHSLGRG